MDLVAALAVGGAAMLGSSSEIGSATLSFSWTIRPWYSWVGRFVVSAASYVVFYWFYGALNYLLVTHSYYTAQQHTVLQIPPTQAILAAESSRGPLLVFAVLPLVLTSSITRRQLAIGSSAVLFIIGGIAPLLLQAGILPTFLFIASGWEIFFQNVSLALVITWFLGHGPKVTETNSPEAASEQEGMPPMVPSTAYLKRTRETGSVEHAEP
jgi:hypothetical protein